MQIDFSASESWNALSSRAELVTSQASNRAEFIKECKSGSLDGVLVDCDRAPSSVATTGRYDQELINALPASLKFILSQWCVFDLLFGLKLCTLLTGEMNYHAGAGYDNIDVESCTKRGIMVSHTPGVVEEATADAAIFLILAALRGFNNGILAIRNGEWQGLVPPPPLRHDPPGKVLGILGLGGFGKKLKIKAEVFGMKVIYHNRKPLAEAEGAEYVGFDELLARSDVLSLSIPLNVRDCDIITNGYLLTPVRFG